MRGEQMNRVSGHIHKCPVFYCVTCGAQRVRSAAATGRGRRGTSFSVVDRGAGASELGFSRHSGLERAAPKCASVDGFCPRIGGCVRRAVLA